MISTTLITIDLAFPPDPPGLRQCPSREHQARCPYPMRERKRLLRYLLHHIWTKSTSPTILEGSGRIRSAPVSARLACRPSIPARVCASVRTGACMASEMGRTTPVVGALLQRSGCPRTLTRDGRASGTRTKGTIACRVRASPISQWPPSCSYHQSRSLFLLHARLTMLALFVPSLGSGHHNTYPP